MNDEWIWEFFLDIIKLNIVHLLSKFYQKYNFLPFIVGR